MKHTEGRRKMLIFLNSSLSKVLLRSKIPVEVAASIAVMALPNSVVRAAIDGGSEETPKVGITPPFGRNVKGGTVKGQKKGGGPGNKEFG